MAVFIGEQYSCGFAKISMKIGAFLSHFVPKFTHKETYLPWKKGGMGFLQSSFRPLEETSFAFCLCFRHSRQAAAVFL